MDILRFNTCYDSIFFLSHLQWPHDCFDPQPVIHCSGWCSSYRRKISSVLILFLLFASSSWDSQQKSALKLTPLFIIIMHSAWDRHVLFVLCQQQCIGSFSEKSTKARRVDLWVTCPPHGFHRLAQRAAERTKPQTLDS